MADIFINTIKENMYMYLSMFMPFVFMALIVLGIGGIIRCMPNRFTLQKIIICSIVIIIGALGMKFNEIVAENMAVLLNRWIG